MICDFNKLQELQLRKNIKVSDIRFSKIIEEYSFFYISDKQYFHDHTICEKIYESRVITIDHFKKINKNHKEIYFIVSFKKTIIILNESEKSFILFILSLLPNLKICFLKNTKIIFDHNINFKYNEITTDKTKFEEEIYNFNQYLNLIQPNSTINNIWKIILPSISGYLIRESYLKLDYNQKHQQSKPKIIDEKEYIELRLIDSGYSCHAKLIYHIKEEKLFVLKEMTLLGTEKEKLLEREAYNYSQMEHPYIPKLYGRTKTEKFLIIEYIDGQTLINIKKMHLNDYDKFYIILRLLEIIKYLNSKNFIYRDLKPNNIIIDRNKYVYLIDFDEMINYNEKEMQTTDFSSDFVAPEIFTGRSHKSSDIYSLGQIIYYIILEKLPNKEIKKNIDDLNEYSEIQSIYCNCIDTIQEKRPSIYELVQTFYLFILNINIISSCFDNKNQDHYNFEIKDRNIKKEISNYWLVSESYISFAQLFIGIFYYQNIVPNSCKFSKIIFIEEYMKVKNIKSNIDKAIYYLTLSSNQNNAFAQVLLGDIYYNGIYVVRNMEKSIYFYTLASNQNNPDALTWHGKIFYEGNYIKQNVDKAIHYFTLGSDQNHPDSQAFLGEIYYEGKYIKRDVNKAIHYFTLASNQNHPDAQAYLGIIYYEGKHIKRDVSKAINYLLLASYQNHPEGQANLGIIYFEGKYIEKNIDKSIHFFHQSSKNFNYLSSFLLGYIFHEGKYVTRNLKNAVYYYKEASSFNFKFAKNNLGIIYKNGFGGISKNTKTAKVFFKEAIRQDEDAVLIYNLSHIYIYDERTAKSIDKSIELLNKTIEQNFIPSFYLLLVAIYLKIGTYIAKLNDLFEEYKEIDFLFNTSFEPIPSKIILVQIKKEKTERKNINFEFYDGFGLPIF